MSSRKPTARILASVIYCVYVLLLIWLQWTDWRSQGDHGDLPSYTALAGDSSSDPVEIFKAARVGWDPNTYRALFHENPYTADLTSIRSNYGRLHPYSFAQGLPFFAVKPLYVTALFLIHHLTGVGIPDSALILSTLSLLLLAPVVFLWMGEVSPSLSLLSCALLALPGVYSTLGISEPDLLFTAVSFASFFLIFQRRKYFPGLILLSITPLIRPEGLILATLVMLYLTLIDGQMTFSQFAILELTQILVNRFVYYMAGGYDYVTLFYASFVYRVPNPAEVHFTFSFQRYFAVLFTLITSSLGTYRVLYIGMAAAAWALSGRRFTRIAYAGVIVILYAAIHTLLFPIDYARFMALSDIVVCIWFIDSLRLHVMRTRPLETAGGPIVD